MTRLLCLKQWAPHLLLAACLSLLPAASHAQVNITTWQVNNQHTGNNNQETVLTPANVGAQGNFVQLFAQPLNDAALEVGQTMGEPLVLTGVNINGTLHTVVFVCTQHGRVYAYDGDTKDAALGTDKFLWEKDLVPSTDAPFLESDTASPDIGPELALTATPVIDPSTKILYVAVKTRRATDNPVTFHHYLYALNAADKSEAIPHIEISATFAGTAKETGSTGTTFPFNPQKEHLRCAMAINKEGDGLLYLAFASHTDGTPYHGEILAYDPKTLRLVKNFSVTRKNNAGGLWGSGASPAFDLSGNLIVMTGNGTYDPTIANGGEWAESFIKLATTGSTLAVGDVKSNSWTPYNYANIDFGDQDLGSGGVLVLPDLPPKTADGTTVAHPKLLLGGGKGAVLYLIDHSYLGGLGTGDGVQINPGNNESNGGDRKFGQINTNSVQEILEATSGGGIFNTPAYFNGYVYCAPGGAPLEQRRFGYDPATGTYLGTLDTAKVNPNDYFQTKVTADQRTPFISSNGTTNGIVWSAIGNGLSAFDATNVSKQIFNANVSVAGDSHTFTPYKWTTPVVANGKVYITGFTGGTGTNTSVSAVKDGYLFVFGLAPTATGAPADPTNAAAQPQSATSIRISWQDNSDNETFFSIRRSTSPTGPFKEWTTSSGTSQAAANATSFVDTTCTALTTYYYQVFAGNVVNGTTTYSHATQTPTGTTTFPTYYENGLVAYWAFDDLGSLTARDLTGNGHTGSLAAEANQIQGGLIGGCLFCHSGNNAQSQVAVADKADLRFTAAQSFTLAAWVNVQSSKANEQVVLVKSIESGSGKSYGLYLSATDANGNARWIARSTDGADITSGTTYLVPGTWTHVALVQDGTAKTRTLYVNGAAVGQGASQAGDGTGPFWMGKQNVSTAPNILNGNLDEVRVYNRALAAAELPNLMGPPVLGAVSNQTHGSAGNYSVLLAPLAAKKVEARQGATAGTYRLALTFSAPVTSIGNIALETTSGTKAIGTVGATSFDSTATVLAVPLTGVGNGQNMRLHLTNIQPGGGSAYVPFNVLWGDVSGDNIVDYIDARAVTSAATSVTRPLSTLLSPYDLNCDGVVDAKDANLVNTQAGKANLGAQATTNVAFCASAIAKSQQNTGKLPGYAFDIDPTTQWDSIQEGDTIPGSNPPTKYTAADVDPQWIMVDLGATCTFNTETINWNAGAKTYYVDVSKDLGSGVDPHPEDPNGSNWSQQRMFNENGTGWTTKGGSTTDGIKTDVGTTCTGRYVRLTGLTRTKQYGYAMYDYQILGTFVSAASGTTNSAPIVTAGSLSATLNANITPYQIQATNSPSGYSVSGLPNGLSVAPDTGLISGAPSQTGTFNASMTAANGSGTSSPATLTVTVVTPYTAWASGYFTAAEQADASVSGPSASPAGDGIPNLMKYALGLNPKQNGTAGLPQVGTTTVGGQSYLSLTYTRRLASTDVNLTVEASGDLTTWQSGASVTAVVSTTNSADGQSQTVVVRDLSAQSASAKRFLRLKASLP